MKCGTGKDNNFPTKRTYTKRSAPEGIPAIPWDTIAMKMATTKVRSGTSSIALSFATSTLRSLLATVDVTLGSNVSTSGTDMCEPDANECWSLYSRSKVARSISWAFECTGVESILCESTKVNHGSKCEVTRLRLRNHRSISNYVNRKLTQK